MCAIYIFERMKKVFKSDKFKIYKKNVLNNFKIATLVIICGHVFMIIFYKFKEIYSIYKESRGNTYFEQIDELIHSLDLIIYIFILIFSLVVLRCLWKNFIRAYKSKRYDIIAVILLSSFYIYIYNSDKYDYVKTVIFLFLVLILSRFYIKTKRGKSLFPSDEPDKMEDLFDIKNDAEKFADKIYNNNSDSSIVFGIDAPWGIGKTTYLEYCIKHLKNKYKKDIIIYEFKPINFKNSNDLFERFVNDLVKSINEKIYAPSVSLGLYQYAKSITGIKLKLPLFGELNVKNEHSVDNAFKNLREELEYINKKVIVTIDDLDRLSLENVKIILNIVRDSFQLPNISYIICYDTENINAFHSNLRKKITKNYITASQLDVTNICDIVPENVYYENEIVDNSKIVEYFEKIVQVKKTLVISRNDIRKCIKKYFVDDCFEKDTARWVADLIDVDFLSKEKYETYAHYIGDIRKIKRIVNIFKLNDKLSKINFKIHGLNPVEFIKLVLVYVNYPNIFRKIYITETDGMGPFFSLISKFGESAEFARYKNDKKYCDYTREVGEKERFLLDDIFLDKNIDLNKDNREGYYYRAAHNGGGAGEKRKLEQYLKLLIKGDLPDPFDEDGFYKDAVEKLLKNNINIIEVLIEFDEEEKRRRFLNCFWQEVLEDNFKIEYYNKYVDPLIKYIMDNISKYSLLDNWRNGYGGLRFYLILYLMDLINRRGWRDKNGESINNTDIHNLNGITEKIFGTKDFDGILDNLSREDKGILGIYDMMLFRLCCSSDRGDKYYNVYSALGYHSVEEKYKRGGEIVELTKIEMRKISQKCFEIFKKRYIDSQKNIFEDAEKLSAVDVFGEFVKNISVYLAKEGINSFEETEKIKNGVVSFILYQLSNDKVDHGIGCGFYDVFGEEDGGKIREIILDYLFTVCFKPTDDEKKNVRYFVYYLMSHLTRNGGGDFHPNKDEFAKLLSEERLKEYWIVNKDAVKKIAHETMYSEKVYTANYTASYNDFEKLTKALDNLDTKSTNNSQ